MEIQLTSSRGRLRGWKWRLTLRAQLQLISLEVYRSWARLTVVVGPFRSCRWLGDTFSSSTPPFIPARTWRRRTTAPGPVPTARRSTITDIRRTASEPSSPSCPLTRTAATGEGRGRRARSSRGGATTSCSRFCSWDTWWGWP